MDGRCRAVRHIAATAVALAALSGCQTTGGGEGAALSSSPPPTAAPDDLVVVDCLLPGQARRLGTRLTYVAARRAVKAPAVDCARRGGEYILPSRNGRDGALSHWMPAALAGDAEAQTYVGEIMERGLGSAPDPMAAAEWYAKAADQGYARALVNLAALHEAGEGVTRDAAKAADLYARAAGLDPATFAAARADAVRPRPAPSPASNPVPTSAAEAENDRLRAELAALRGELGAARSRLDGLSAKVAEADARAGRLAVERDRLARRLESETGAAESDDLAAALAETEAALATEREEASALRQRLLDAQARAETQVAALRDTDAAATAEVDRLRRDLREARRTLTERERTLRALVERERDATAEAERLAAERVRLADALGAAAGDEDRVAALEAELAARDRALDESGARATALKAEIERVRAESAAELAEAERTVEALLAERASETARLEGDLAASRAETAALRADLDEARSALAERRAAVALLTEERRALETRLAARASGPSEADRARVRALEAQITQNERALAESDARVEALTEQLAAIRQAVGTAQRSPTPAASAGPDETIEARLRRFLSEARDVFGSYRALVIGNNTHRFLPDLETPHADTEAIARVLRERYGFEVEVLHDANRYQIMSALNRYYRTLTEDDNFLLYYAGHGEIDEINERGHWLPTDAEADNRANWISAQSVTDILNAMSARKVLVVSDSCYSGVLTRGSITALRPGMNDASLKRFLLTMAEKRSRMVMSSGGERPVLDGAGGGHSIFARAFIDVLAENDNVLEGFALHRRLAEAVTHRAAVVGFKQTPEYAPMRYAGHESGDFFFIPVGAI